LNVYVLKSQVIGIFLNISLIFEEFL